MINVELERKKGQETKERVERWKIMAMSRRRIRDVEGVVDMDKSWLCLRLRDLNTETEGMIIVAQDQDLRTKAVKRHVEKRIYHPHTEFVEKEMSQ